MERAALRASAGTVCAGLILSAGGFLAANNRGAYSHIRGKHRGITLSAAFLCSFEPPDGSQPGRRRPRR